MQNEYTKDYILQYYNIIKNIEDKAIIDNDNIMLAISSYAPMLVHRITSNYKYKKNNHFILPIIVIISAIYLTIESYFKKFRRYNRGLREVGQNQKVMVWINNYQYPEIDDYPFQEIANNKGYIVLRPCINSICSLIKQLIIGIYLSFYYHKKLKKFINNLNSQLNESNKHIIDNNILYNAFCTKKTINTIAKSYLIQYPFCKKLSRFADKLIIVHRNNGDISASIFNTYRKKIKYNSDKKIIQILFSHVGSPVNIPNSTVGRHIDQIWVKNKFAKDVFQNRADTKHIDKIFILGDPRQDIIYKQRKQNKNKNSIIIALTEKPKEFFLQGQSPNSLNLVLDIIKFTEPEMPVELKRRAPLSTREKLFSCFYSHSVREILKYTTSKGLPESAVWARFAIILGNEQTKLVSSVVFDYLQAGVPTIIVLPGIEDLSEVRDWKKVSSDLRPVLYTEPVFRKYLIDNNLEELEKNAVSFKDNFLTVQQASTNTRENFNYLLNNI